MLETNELAVYALGNSLSDFQSSTMQQSKVLMKEMVQKVTDDFLSLTQAIGIGHTTIGDFDQDKNELEGEGNTMAT